MTKVGRFRRTLAAVVFLLSGAPMSNAEGAASSPSPGTVAAGVAEVRGLVRQGRFDEALAVLRPLAEAHPERREVLFLHGLAAAQSATRPGRTEDDRERLLDEAISSFRTVLIDRPELVRVRLELARAFFLGSKDTLARRHFERVLAGDLPPAVIANVQRFLREIRARRRWSFYFGAALAPDSNIGAASDERFIQILGLPFRRDAEELTTSGVGLSLWTGGEYQHPLGDRLRLRAGGDVSRREYGGSAFDQTLLSVHVGPRWLAGERTEVSLLGNASRRLVAGDGDYDDFGFRTEATHRLTPRVSANSRASWHDRRYRTDRHLDGPVLDLSVGGRWVVTPTLRVDGSVGYGSARPALERSRSSSRWLRAGAQMALPRGFAVGVSTQLRWTDFEGDWLPFTPDGAPREDRTRTLSASAHHRRFTLYGFSPELVLTTEARSSNAQLHDYRKNLAELRFIRQF